MNCVNYGGPLKEKMKRVRASGCTPAVLELIGVLLIIFTFFTVIGPIIGFLFLILGHNAAYTKEKVYVCKACKSELPTQQSN